MGPLHMTYMVPQFIMAWFHSHHSKIDSAIDVERLFTDMTDTAPKAPRRMRMTQFYSKRFYDTRIKPVFDPEWAAVLASTEATKPSRINVLNSITSRLWENEPSSFKTWLQGQRDAAYERELEEHQRVVKEMETAPNTAETYHS